MDETKSLHFLINTFYFFNFSETHERTARSWISGDKAEALLSHEKWGHVEGLQPYSKQSSFSDKKAEDEIFSVDAIK